VQDLPIDAVDGSDFHAQQRTTVEIRQETPTEWRTPRPRTQHDVRARRSPPAAAEGIDVFKDWLYGITMGLAVSLMLIGVLAAGVLLLA
jgi:hypothetical protein